MPDMLATASAWLDSTLKTSASQAVVYRRGSDTVSVSAVIGETPLGSVLDDGQIQSWQSRDWLIQAADLILSGAEVLPQDGDRIQHTLGGWMLEFQVFKADDGRAWRYSDEATRGTLRIHTKQVGKRVSV